jgi:hypothetical protein
VLVVIFAFGSVVSSVSDSEIRRKEKAVGGEGDLNRPFSSVFSIRTAFTRAKVV